MTNDSTTPRPFPVHEIDGELYLIPPSGRRFRLRPSTEERLTAHVRAHVHGCTPQSLVDAGYSIGMVVGLIEAGRLAETTTGRIRYVWTDADTEVR